MVSALLGRAGVVRHAIWIAAVYLAFGCLWIWLSDAWLAGWVAPSDLSRFQTYKGWFYVGVTALLVFLLVWHRLRATAQLASEVERAGQRMRAVFDTVNDALLIHDAASGAVVDANARACELFGHPRDALLQFDFVRLTAADSAAAAAAASAVFRQAVRGEVQRVEWRTGGPAGEPRWIEFTLRRAAAQMDDFVVVAARDISPGRRMQESLQRSNARLRMLSECNQALVRATDVDGLAAAVCRSAVRAGGYACGWVAVADGPDGALRVTGGTAGASKAAQEPDEGDESAMVRALADAVMRDGGTLVGQGLRRAPPSAVWREAARHGYDAACVVPLVAEGVRFGALALFARNPDAFADDDVELIQELADDLAFGIAAQRQRDSLLHSRRETERARLLLQRMIDAIPDLIFVRDAAQRYLVVNHACARALGMAPEDMVGRSDDELWPADGAGAGAASLLRAGDGDAGVLAGNSWRGLSRQLVSADGTRRVFDVLKQSVVDASGGRALFGYARDISERVGVEARYRMLFDQVPVATWVYDPETLRFLEVNRAAEELYGYARDEFLTMTVSRLADPQDAERYEASIRTLQGPVMRLGRRHRRKDGRALLVDIFADDFVEIDNRRVRVVTVRDVTASRRIEQDRDRLLRQLQLQIERMPIGYLLFDPEWRVEAINPAAERMFGWRSDEIRGRCVFGTLIPDTSPARDGALAQSLREALPGDEMVSLDIGRDGRRMHCHWYNTPLVDAHGRVTGGLAMVVDVTERERMQARIRESEALLNAIIDGTSDAVFVKDNDGRYLLFNRAAAEMAGTESGAVMGADDFAVFPDGAARALRALDERVMLTGAAHTEEIRVARADGGVRVLQTTGGPLRDGTGAAVGVFGIARDVTALKFVEDRLRELSRRLVHAQEHERRNLSRELHDQIGQQLAALKLNLAALAQAHGGDGLRLRVQDCIEIVDTTLAQIRDRAMNLRPPMLDDMGLAAALEWYCRRQSERSDCIVQCALSPLPPALHEDLEIAAFRIVQEAVNNALRHSDASRVDVTIETTPFWLILRIEDNGQGMASGMATKMHEGLGITGMRERAEWLAGTFEIHSRPGVGTRVHVDLPLGVAQ